MIRSIPLLALSLGLGTARADEPIVIKLATMAPEGTTWAKGLHRMADQWATLSNGQVQVKIYPGGVAGHEGTVVRKMRIGQLQAGALSNQGLLDIDSGPQVINTPMLIRNYDELDAVMDAMIPTFEARLSDKGFIVLNWSEIGWVHFFTREAMRVPADTQRFKMWCWDGDPGAVTAFRKGGFNPVVISSVDMIPSLQSGLIDGFPATPLSALSMQWFALAPHMLDVPWAPEVGATIISKTTWDQIPEALHAPLLAAAREVGEGLKQEIRKQDKKAIEVMQRYGLVVEHVDEPTRLAWQERARAVYPEMREDIVPTEIFDQVTQFIQRYRAGQ